MTRSMPARNTFFYNYINNTLQKQLDNFVIVYLDNILIYSDNKAEYKIYIKQVLQKLIDTGLQVDITKYTFYVIEVPYLGLIITTQGVKINPSKVNTIVNWPSFINIKDV